MIKLYLLFNRNHNLVRQVGFSSLFVILFLISTLHSVFGQSDCKFQESGGLVVVEMEGVKVPDNWSATKNGGLTFIEWDDKEYFNTPGNGTITYNVNFTQTGLYRFVWRNKVNSGSATNEHNDTWLRIPNSDSIVYFGHKGSEATIEVDFQAKNEFIVFPKGTNLGNPVVGPSSDGWFKIYDGGLNWNWTTDTNEEDPYEVYVNIKVPGTYPIEVSGRASFHAIDKMVMYHLDTYGRGGLSDEELHSFKASNNNCSGISFVNNNSDGKCDFQEDNGLILIETESNVLPAGWGIIKSGGKTFIEWDNPEQFNKPGTDAFSYFVNVETTGIYRLQINSKINEGTNNSSHNDTWLKVPNNENVVFFGFKGGNATAEQIDKELTSKSTKIVFPAGTGLGNTVAGPSVDGWVKYYSKGLNWTWGSYMNDENPFDIYVKFNQPGLYEVQLAGRAKYHALNKIVMYHVATQGNNLGDDALNSMVESGCSSNLEFTDNTAGDSLALLLIHERTAGAGWTNPWPLGQAMDNWSGVKLDANRRVTELTLDNRGLKGQLPREIGYLSKLTKIDISNNEGLAGRVPDEIGELPGLVNLTMANNSIGGSFPQSIANLTKLAVLDLRNNSISGTLPANFGSLVNLKLLHLENNSFSGTFQVGVGSLVNLTELNIANNTFTGDLPPGIINLVALKLLNMAGNQFTGAIPVGIGALKGLQTLSLGSNQLTGTIPPAIGNLTALTNLILGSNLLTGDIPTSFDSLKNLTNLNLSVNQLTGPLPAGMGTIAGLKSVYLNDNMLSGAIPAGWVNSTVLTNLTLANNAFSTLPAITSPSLNNITAENNQLSFDDIIPNIGKLTSYAPQDTIGEERDEILIAGDQLVIDLGIDKNVTSSVYNWYKDSTFLKLTLESKLVLDNVTAASLGSYTCKITNMQAPDLTLFTNPVHVIVNSPPAFTSEPVKSVASGETYTYNITAADPNTSDSVKFGSTVLPAWLTLTDNGDGTAVLSGTPTVGDCSDDSVSLVVSDKGALSAAQSFNIAISVGFSVTVDTSAAAICKNEPVTFTANLVNPGPNPTYQWFLDGQPMQGATANNITTSTLLNNQTVKVQVKVDSAACLVNTTAESEPIVVQVTEVTTMSVLMSAPTTDICSSDTVTFATTLINQGPNPVYQWLINDEPVVGENKAALVKTQLNDGDVVKVKVTSDNSGCMLNTEAESKPVTVKVTESKLLDISLAADQTEVEAGNPVKFTATTSYSASAVKYQWFINGEPVANQTNPTFTSSTLANGDKVKAKITAEPVPCISATEVESEEIAIVVNADITLKNLEKTTKEETKLAFAAADFSSSFTSSLGDLATVKITVLPTNGVLTLGDGAVNVNQEIALDQISGLAYTPGKDFSGTETIKWNGTEGTQYGATDASVIVQVTPVNDAPAFTLSEDIKVNMGFETTEKVTVTPGAVPADEADQTVTYSLNPETLPFANMSINPATGEVSITAFGLRFGMLEVEVIANDGQTENNTFSQKFVVEVVNPSNSAPYDIMLESSIISENLAVGDVATNIIVGDYNSSDEHIVTLDSSVNAPDNSYFRIEDSKLIVNKKLDFETKNKLNIAIKAADPSGSSLVKPFIVTIKNENDVPSSLNISDSLVVQGSAVGTVVANLSTIDEDRGDQHTYSILPEGDDYMYFTISGDQLVIADQINYQEKDNFTITIRSEDSQGGIIDRTITLVLGDISDAFANIKTGITPNADGFNDTWKIENIENYPNAKIEIFDSWGNRIFYSVGYENEWDGTRDSKDLPTGTYYYVIDLNSGDEPIKGTVTLLR